MKKCNTCLQQKEESEFYFNASYQKSFYCCKQCTRERTTQWQNNNVEKFLWLSAKNRAKKNGIEFELEVSDIVIPKTCPVLNIPIMREKGNYRTGPSIDRINNKKGYYKDNIVIISNRANRIKSDLTIEEIEKVYLYFKNIKQF